MRQVLMMLAVVTLTVSTGLLQAQDDIILDPATEDTVVEQSPGGLEKMPELKEFVKADYPADLIKRGIEGTVTMDLLISDSGIVESAAVVIGVQPGLDSSALKAARAFTFSPAMAGGQPVAVLLQYEYHFSLTEAAKEIGSFVNFEGRLVEQGTRTPITDAMVVLSFIDTLADTTLPVPFGLYRDRIGAIEGQYLEESRLVTLTDSAGHFRFHSLPAGSVLISAPLPGYESLEERELITKGEVVTATYRIRSVSYNNYEVVAYGRQEKKEVSRRQLTMNEVKKVPGLGGDAIKVVQALPGVARPVFSSGAVIVRGSGNEDTRYFLDGVEIPALFHFGGLKSTYNADLLGAIDMYPGGFNTRYGGAVGGIVEITGRSPKTDRWHGKADANLLDASFLAEGPINEKLSLAVTARKSYFGALLKQALKDAPTTIIPSYWDMVARLEYRPHAGRRMFLTAFTSSDELEMIISGIRGGSSEISEQDKALQGEFAKVLIGGYDQSIGKTLENNLRLSIKHNHADGGFFGFNKYDFTIVSSYLRDQCTWTPNEKIKAAAGVDLDADYLEYKASILSSSGPVDFASENYYTNLGVYANTELSPVPGLLVIPGLRYDYYNELGEGTPTYRLTARYEFTKGHTIKTALGTYSQSPRPYGQAIDSAWGNPDLPPTTASHLVGGYEWQINDLLSLDAQAYYNRQSDIPRAGYEINPATGKPYNFLPDMEGRMYGLELMLRHDQGKRFFGWIAYSLSRSERKAPGPVSTAWGRPGSWDPDAWVVYGMDQTHNLQVLGSWRLPREWETGFRFRYVTGNPDTPRLSYTENRIEYDSDYARYIPLNGEPLSDRMGPFVQLDLRVEKKFIYNNWILSSYVDLQNAGYFLYNSPEFYQYNYDGTKREAIGGILIPAAGICAEF